MLWAEVTYYRYDANAFFSSTGPVTGPDIDDMILSIISVTPHIRKADIAELCSISFKGVKYHIDKLKKAGRLEWTGNSRNGQWVIKDAVVTIKGSSTIGTLGDTTGEKGNVFGGGEQSYVTGATSKVTVNIEGDTQVYGNVFGGGDEGVVEGSTEVNIQSGD